MTPDPAISLSQQIVDDGKVEHDLAGGGYIRVARLRPYLCVYRFAGEQGDEQVLSVMAHLNSVIVAPATLPLGQIVAEMSALMRAEFGDALIVDIARYPAPPSHSSNDGRPTFHVAATGESRPQRTLNSLMQRLRRGGEVADWTTGEPSRFPRAADRVELTPAKSRRRGFELIELAICGDLNSGGNESDSPHLGTLENALQHAFFTFCRTRTNARPPVYYSVGRRSLTADVVAVDRRLAEISDRFEFLLQVTPVNAESAWRGFERSKLQQEPRFFYRSPHHPAGTLKRELFSVDVESIEDPTLHDLFRQRQDELDRKITMLTDIGSEKFLLGSRLVFGDIEPPLIKLASRVLNELPWKVREETGDQVHAEELASIAGDEIEHYRRQMPGFAAKVELRSDMFNGMLCSNGNLLIGRNTTVPRNRVEPLLHHEIGTHLLTYYNGLVQPLRLLHAGLAGYDGFQEGIAVLAEYLVGGLSVSRVRLLAARVLACQMVVEGADFVQTFRTINRQYGFSQKIAYTVTMRVFRGGGLTKDSVYLRGLLDVLDYIRAGGQLSPLFVGKIARDHVQLVNEFLRRKVLASAQLMPRYLQLPAVQERLEVVRRSDDLVTLLGL